MSESSPNPTPPAGEPLCALAEIELILGKLNNGEDVPIGEVRTNFKGGNIPLKTASGKEWNAFCEKCGGGALLATAGPKDHIERVLVGEAMLERCEVPGLPEEFIIRQYISRRRID